MSIEQIKLSRNKTSDLPNKKAVYAVFAQHKTSHEPVHCRYVGETDNLAERTTAHFSPAESNDRLKEFLQSGKTKLMLYELMPDSTEEDRQEKVKTWIKKHRPMRNK